MASKKSKVGVIICGGCNPQFDRAEILEYIKSEFAEYAEFSYYDASKEYSFVLVINGCGSECLIDEIDKPYVLVSNDKRDDIREKIARKLNEINS